MWPLLLLLLVPEDVAPLVVLAVFQPLVLNPLVVQPLGLMSAHSVMLLTIACSLVLFGFAKPITSEVLAIIGPTVLITLLVENTRPQSTTATAGVSSTASASPTLIDVSDLSALIQQIMSAFGNPSTALSASTDVDVPADPPDDTLHVAPPSIVHLVESSSTNPAPLQLCLLFLYLVTFLSVVPLE
ncbi:hypothetical protein Acr_26g0011140 [Actinidia rufa]|uniref:Uncharacterized protein n=1 Tax=Actinidia rufa TaxID=165716 RepID=A0A7J0H507_9ERIC|nr:hypothetical protein Acr_26g0011140 [Actinidia rufa]